MKLYAEKIDITSASTCWGSCNGHARLYFSWKMVLGNMEIGDYVVVHELTHIKEKITFADFEALLKDICQTIKRQGVNWNSLN